VLYASTKLSAEKRPISLVVLSIAQGLQLEKLCQSIYFPTEILSPGAITLMHGLIYFCIDDFMKEHDSFTKEHDCSTYRQHSGDAFAVALAQYDTLAIPTLENIQALSLGARLPAHFMLVHRMLTIPRQCEHKKRASSPSAGSTSPPPGQCPKPSVSTANPS